MARPARSPRRSTAAASRPFAAPIPASPRAWPTRPARRAARERPKTPIVALTPNLDTSRRLTLTWGALWQDFSPDVMLTGVVFSLLVQVLFPMPPVP